MNKRMQTLLQDARERFKKPCSALITIIARFRSDGPNNPARQPTLEPGQTIWLARSQQKRFENLGETSLELLRFDLRTAPAEPTERRKKGGK